MGKNNKKILLITPPYYRLYNSRYSLNRYPLSLGYLSGAILDNTSWEVMTYNADFCQDNEQLQVSYLAGEGFNNYLKNINDLTSSIWDEVKETIRDFNPSVIGLSCMTQNFKGAYNIAKIAKELNEDILVIVGGPHANMFLSEVLDYPYIDICAVGEGEETIVELLNTIDGNNDFNTVTGIIYRIDGKVVVNQPRELLKDLDSLSFPHKYAHKVLKNYDRYPVEAFHNIFAIRGCPFNCIFCGSIYIWGRKPRYRSIDNVIEEIRNLSRMGVKRISFEDDSFGIKKSYILELAEKINVNCPSVKWSCEMHVKTVTEEIVSAMSDSGCCKITLGVESGNNDILKKIRKKNTIEDCIHAGKIISKFNIELGAFFMVGFPWETEETLKDTIRAMKKLNADYSVYSIFTPYKGSEAFSICKDMGLISDDYDFSIYNHQSPLNCFCKNISKERFRKICSKMERISDKRGIYYQLIKPLTSLKTIRKIKNKGLKGVIKKVRNLALASTKK